MTIEQRILNCTMLHPNQSSVGAIESMLRRTAAIQGDTQLSRVQILAALRRLKKQGKVRRGSFDNYSRLVPLEDA